MINLRRFKGLFYLISGLAIVYGVIHLIPERWFLKSWFKISAILSALGFIYLIKRLEKRYVDRKYIKDWSQ